MVDAVAVFDTFIIKCQLAAKGGFSAVQAEAITEAVRFGVTGGVATKVDVAELRAAFASCETRLILTLAGMMMIAVAILGSLIRWLVPPT